MPCGSGSSLCSHLRRSPSGPTAPAGGVLQVRPVGKGEWTQQGLDAYKPILERLATALSLPGAEDEVEPDPSTELLGSIGKLLGLAP